MSTKKEDPRAVRSKLLLKAAALSLLIESQDLQKLTVQKVAAKAGLNRATFYLHFLDLRDLLRHIIYDFFDELNNKMSPLLELENSNLDESLLAFLDYFYVQRKSIAVLFEEKSFQKKFHNTIVEFIQVRRELKGEVKEEAVSEDIIAASILGILVWWVRDGKQYSPEYIAQQLALRITPRL